ncbi:UNVERIFIED_CONTAM: hypothetical protein HDU68_000076 [Siphonaria sp. JEL0065]|nr:hypothetical protein HDU68_000076 [Siphonaria sp. JEL0065]
MDPLDHRPPIIPTTSIRRRHLDLGLTEPRLLGTTWTGQWQWQKRSMTQTPKQLPGSDMPLPPPRLVRTTAESAESLIAWVDVHVAATPPTPPTKTQTLITTYASTTVSSNTSSNTYRPSPLNPNSNVSTNALSNNQEFQTQTPPPPLLLQRFLNSRSKPLSTPHLAAPFCRSVSDMTTQTDSSQSQTYSSQLHQTYLQQQQRMASTSLRDSPSSTRTSVSSSMIEDTDDPVRLKELLRISRSANRKLDSLVRSLQRHNDAIRNSLSSIQRTLTSERDARFLRDQIAFENAKKKEDEDELDAEATANEMLQLRDQIRRLEDQVEDLKYRTCSGNCNSMCSSSSSASGTKKMVGRKPPSSITTPTTATISAASASSFNHIAPLPKPPRINSSSSTNSSATATPISLKINVPPAHHSPITSPSEQGYSSGDLEDGNISDALEAANSTISSIGKEIPILSRHNSFSKATNNNNNNNTHTPVHRRNSFTLHNKEDFHNSSTSPFDDIEFEDDTATTTTGDNPPIPLVTQFFNKATSQLVQQLNNNVRRWETIQSDLDEIVAEFQYSSGSGSLESISESNGGGSDLVGKHQGDGFAARVYPVIIGDSECIHVIIESFVRVLETRVDKLGMGASGIQATADKFFSKFSEYSNLISKYQHTPGYLLETLEKVCISPPILPLVTTTTKPTKHQQQSTTANYRPQLFHPILSSLYTKKLIDAEDIVEWFTDLQDSIANQQALQLTREEVCSLTSILEDCEGDYECAVKVVEGARDIACEERFIDEHGSECSDEEEDEEEEEEWDDDGDWLGGKKDDDDSSDSEDDDEDDDSGGDNGSENSRMELRLSNRCSPNECILSPKKMVSFASVS